MAKENKSEIKDNKKEKKSKQKSPSNLDYEESLDNTISDAKKRIEELEGPDYEELLELEKKGKNRKGMKEYLKEKSKEFEKKSKKIKESGKDDQDKPVGEVLKEVESKERKRLEKDIQEHGAVGKGDLIQGSKSKLGFFKTIKNKFTGESSNKAPQEYERENIYSGVQTFPAKVSVEQEIDLKKLTMQVEKVQLELSSLRNMKQQNSEQIRKIMEGLGEVRSLVFQKEALVDELKTKIRKLEDVVSDIEPRKIRKDLSKRETELMEHSAKLEKLDKLIHDQTKEIKSNKEILDQIKSIENLRKTVKEIQNNVSKINKLKSDTKRYAGLAEKIHVEIDKKLSKLSQLENRLEKNDELLKEMVSSIDKNKIEINNRVSKEELGSLKKSFNKIQNKLENSNQKKEISVSFDKDENSKGVEEKKKEIQELIKNIEKYKKEGKISEEEYEEMKKSNKKYLGRLEERPNQEFIENHFDSKEEAIEVKMGNQMEKRSQSGAKLRRELGDLEINAKEKTPRKSSHLNDTLKELILQKKELENMIFLIKKQQKQGIIEKENYFEMKNRTIDKIGDVNRRISTVKQLINQPT